MIEFDPTSDFHTVPERRGTASLKWDVRPDPDLLPMWVADMDFEAPPVVLEALRERVGHGVFGYAIPPLGLNDLVCHYVKTHYGWRIDPDWIVWLPGLVSALHAVTRACTQPGEQVAVPTPVYPPFLDAPRKSERTVIEVPFLEEADGWKLDLQGIEKAAADGAKLLLFCNPHNPLGRVLRRSDLEELCRISEAHDLIICSDEVHCDLILDDIPHVPLASLGEGIAQRSVTLMAASKTFNIAGLGCAFGIISNPELRKNLKAVMHGISGEVNPVGFAATEAALAGGEAWRQDLLSVLRRNRDDLERYIAEIDAPVTMQHVEATYLAWLDLRRLPPNKTGASLRKAGLWLSDSEPFGTDRFLRLNFGCPHARLMEGLERFRRWAVMD